MIPKVIHYCWFGENPLPSNTKKYIETWKKYCPDYEIKQWNESNFDVNSHPFMRAAYEVKAWAFVSDYARLKIIYDNGGIYLDTDVELLKNLDFLLQNDFYIGVQQLGKLCNTGLGFGAVAKNNITKKMLDKYDRVTFCDEKRKELACPGFNTDVLKEIGYRYSDNIVCVEDKSFVFPPKYFDPVSPGDSINLICEDTISIHHYSASWGSKSEKYKRKIFTFIGQQRINKLKKSFRDL